MRLFNELCVIVDRAVCRRILDKRAENGVVEFKARVIVDLNFDSEWLRARSDNFDRLRMAIVSDEKGFSIRNGRVTKRHRFSGGGRLIEHRRVGNIELGKIDNHCLKIEKRFETTLRELGLVWRVSSIPPRVFKDVPLNHRWRDAIRITCADKRFRGFVFLRNRAQLGERFVFRLRFRQI